MRRPVDVPIREEPIRLGQFLKLADFVEAASDATELISAGEVFVNGEPETRRGRQLRVGDVVELNGLDESRQLSSRSWRISHSSNSMSPAHRGRRAKAGEPPR